MVLWSSRVRSQRKSELPNCHFFLLALRTCLRLRGRNGKHSCFNLVPRSTPSENVKGWNRIIHGKAPVMRVRLSVRQWGTGLSVLHWASLLLKINSAYCSARNIMACVHWRDCLERAPASRRFRKRRSRKEKSRRDFELTCPPQKKTTNSPRSKLKAERTNFRANMLQKSLS